MGNRANIKILELNGNSIYVYSHWDGRELAERLKTLLRACKDRWSDSQYLQGYVISKLCNSGSTEITGYGISTERHDNERDVFEMDSALEKVCELSKDGWHDSPDPWPRVVIREWGFQEFIDEEILFPESEE